MRQMQRLRNIDINNAKLRSLGLDGLGKRSRDEERAPIAKRARHGPPPSSEWRRSSRGVERAQTNNNERERELLEGVEARPLLSLDEAQAGLLEKQEQAAQAAALLRADEERRLLILTSPLLWRALGFSSAAAAQLALVGTHVQVPWKVSGGASYRDADFRGDDPKDAQLIKMYGGRRVVAPTLRCAVGGTCTEPLHPSR
jgi:hypothetical protein